MCRFHVLCHSLQHVSRKGPYEHPHCCCDAGEHYCSLCRCCKRNHRTTHPCRRSHNSRSHWISNLQSILLRSNLRRSRSELHYHHSLPQWKRVSRRYGLLWNHRREMPQRITHHCSHPSRTPAHRLSNVLSCAFGISIDSRANQNPVGKSFQITGN